METLIIFNGVTIVLTTGADVSEVQSFIDRADAIISVDQGWAPRVLWAKREWVRNI